MPMLELRQLHVHYGAVHALKGISLTIESGEIVALIGANGAGKSTSLMTISGILHPSSGEIIFENDPIHDLPPEKIVQRGISQSPEGRRIFPRLTVRENLLMGSFILGRDSRIQHTLKHVFDLFPVLSDRSSQKGGTLSGGEQQMLAIGRALMASPRLLLLDEPSLGLAPILVERVFQKIIEINRQGVTVLIVEQNANQALHLSNRAYVMETGFVVIEGSSEDLLKDANVRKVYLGEDHHK